MGSWGHSRGSHALYLMIMQLDESKKKAQTSREVRSETRRLQSTFSEYLDMGDLFKFNQLKVGYVLYICSYVTWEFFWKILFFVFFWLCTKVIILLFTKDICSPFNVHSIFISSISSISHVSCPLTQLIPYLLRNLFFTCKHVCSCNTHVTHMQPSSVCHFEDFPIVLTSSFALRYNIFLQRKFFFNRNMLVSSMMAFWRFFWFSH